MTDFQLPRCKVYIDRKCHKIPDPMYTMKEEQPFLPRYCRNCINMNKPILRFLKEKIDNE